MRSSWPVRSRVLAGARGRGVWALAALLGTVVLGGVLLGACSDDGGDGSGDRPSVVVTTSILGDVVSSLLGNAAEVTVVVPRGAAPHDFQASARDARAMREADLLVVNGAGFEEGLLDVVESAAADGVRVHEAIAPVDAIDLPGGGTDPHFFTDPARMAVAAEGILEAALEAAPALDTAEVRARAEAYVDQLRSLDAEVAAILDVVPEPRRVLVTSHLVFGYLADRYDFEVVGAVLPGGGTGEGASAADLAALATRVEEAGVPAVFAEASSSLRLVEALADEVGGIEVVVLHAESLGAEGSGAETYLDLVRANAQRIAGALAAEG